MRRGTSSAVAVATSVLLVAGCDTQAPTPASTPPAVSSATPASTPAPADPSRFPGTVTGTGFTLPSQNISCGFSSRERGDVLCQIESFDYTPGPSGDCHGGGFWGNAVQLTAAGVRFVCGGGVESGGPTLDYGRQLTVGTMICTSTEAGVTCKDTTTGHGFALARSQFRFF